MPLREPKYRFNQGVLKVYGYGDNKKIALVTLSCMRVAGVEDEDEVRPARGSVNDVKLARNIVRSKQAIFELAYCNPWDYFFTATLNPKWYDRTNLQKFHRDFTQWITNYNRIHGTNIKYLLIPELHSDGKSWHMHGFLYGLPPDHLRRFIVGDVMGAGLAKKVLQGDTVYNWPAYAGKFGFCDLEPIKNPEAVSKYVTKYISKDLYNSVRDLNAHLYYHSRGLNRAEIIAKGTVSANTIPLTITCENDYCTKFECDYSSAVLDELLNLFE